jgi:NADH-quinone oxidoreductase subunit J
MDGFGTVEGVGTTLFTDYLLPFELTSVLILIAIIGVVAIAKKRAS